MDVIWCHSTQSALVDFASKIRQALALAFIKQMASLNASLSSMPTAGGGGGGGGAEGSQGNLLDWADKLYGQSISAVTKAWFAKKTLQLMPPSFLE